ncbi:MAG TPA: hypothetical protein VFE78_36570 [Gemmataceae bacterium]|nr:hypothetical protein [Gemmataceae bacterium]
MRVAWQSSWWLWLRRASVVLLLALVGLGVRLYYRHHQAVAKLDEALAALDRDEPGWRLEDVEAAREEIPEGQNSARAVLAAARLLPRPWPPPGFDDLFVQLTPTEQLAPEASARLNQELEDLRPALEEARALTALPHGRYPIAYQGLVYETLLPHADKVRQVSHLLTRDALRHEQRSDLNAALASCRASLNAARSLGDEPVALSQLVRTACVINTCQALERALAQGEPPPGGLTVMQGALHGEDGFPDMLVAARGERAALHATFSALESGAVPPSRLESKPPNWLDYLYGPATRIKFREAHPAMLEPMNRFVEIARLPPHEQDAAERQLDSELRGLKRSDPLAVLFIPALQKVSQAACRKHAYLRCMEVALAAERYRQANKKWPELLDNLCPDLLAAVPLDPFDGQPLRYRRLEDGVMIYSVSHDGEDNGGNLDPAHPMQPGVDVGCRLWDVKHRRRPPRPPGKEAPDEGAAP